MFPLMKSNCFQLMLTKLQLFYAELLPVSRDIPYPLLFVRDFAAQGKRIMFSHNFLDVCSLKNVFC